MDNCSKAAGGQISVTDTDESAKITPTEPQFGDPVEYKPYKYRFVGCVALCLLNAVGGMNWLWFSAITVRTAEQFNLSLTKVNWLSICVSLVFLPTIFLIPWFARRFGVRVSCIIAAVGLVLASWLRYAGTAKGLSPRGSYILLLLGQFFAGVSQPWYQVLAPKYSETWFGLKGRVTATMVVSLMNPVGGAIAQLLSPSVGTPKQSILIVGIISTAIAPVSLLLREKPPMPPTFSGSKRSPPVLEIVRSMLGFPRPEDDKSIAMTTKERRDFALLTYGFGIFVGVVCAFSILVAQIYQPYGYNADDAGFLGAALFISGIVGAVSTLPLFDRVLSRHLALSVRIIIPLVVAPWLGLIWAGDLKLTCCVLAPAKVGLAPSYILLALSGFGGFTLLPVVLELGCEVTRNAEMSSAVLWSSANAFIVIFVLASDALRKGPHSNPPNDMRDALILFAASTVSVFPLVGLLTGKQRRREMDEQQVLGDTVLNRVNGSGL